jgi:hypothetical protein
MTNEVEKKGGNVVKQRTFKALFKLGEKKPKAFGKILNEIEL